MQSIVCSGSTLGPPTGWRCLENLCRKAPVRILIRGPKNLNWSLWGSEGVPTSLRAPSGCQTSSTCLKGWLRMPEGGRLVDMVIVFVISFFSSLHRSTAEWKAFLKPFTIQSTLREPIFVNFLLLSSDIYFINHILSHRERGFYFWFPVSLILFHNEASIWFAPVFPVNVTVLHR